MRLDVLGKPDGTRIDVALKVSGTSMTVRHHDSMAYGGLLRQNLAEPLFEITCQYQVTLAAFVLVPAEGKNDPLGSFLPIMHHSLWNAERWQIRW